MRWCSIALVLVARILAPDEAPWCGDARITGYVRSEFSDWTYDGTSIWTSEPIVAASWDIALGSLVDIMGLGTYRVADRGMLGSGVPMPHIDVPVDTREEAYGITSIRPICVRTPTGDRASQARHRAIEQGD